MFYIHIYIYKDSWNFGWSVITLSSKKCIRCQGSLQIDGGCVVQDVKERIASRTYTKKKKKYKYARYCWSYLLVVFEIDGDTGSFLLYRVVSDDDEWKLINDGECFFDFFACLSLSSLYCSMLMLLASISHHYCCCAPHCFFSPTE